MRAAGWMGVTDGAGERAFADFDARITEALPALMDVTAAAEPRSVYRAVMRRLEGPLLRRALDLSGGNQLKAARLLGINRNTLRKRLRLLGLLPSARA
jgi:two-component system nitrogen regulation response regulator GlnG